MHSPTLMRWRLGSDQYLLVKRSSVNASLKKKVNKEVSPVPAQLYRVTRERLWNIKKSQASQKSQRHSMEQKVHTELDRVKESSSEDCDPPSRASKKSCKKHFVPKPKVSLLEGSKRQLTPQHLPPAQLVDALDGSLATHYSHLQKLRMTHAEEVETASSPSIKMRFLHSCINQQKDVTLTHFDFVVELCEGEPFRGPIHFEEYGEPLRTDCKQCRAPSFLRLLKNSTEAEKCLFMRKKFQGTLSSLCCSCLEEVKESAKADCLQLKMREGFLTEEERNEAIVLRLPSCDFSNQMQAYRLFHWMQSRNISVRIQTIEEPSPHFILKDRENLIKLEQQMHLERKGEQVEASPSVCVPHFKDPLDEALSTMNGRRSFMQTSEAQPYSCVNRMSKALLECLRERKWQFIGDGTEEALLGSYQPERWPDDFRFTGSQ